MTIQSDSQQEQWMEYPKEDGSIFVSTLGRVAQIKILNQVPRSPGSRLSGKNYLCVSTNGHKHLVHRMVLETFRPNPDPVNLTQVNHKDENPENNSLDNLEWCTAHYNSNYGHHKENITKGMEGWMLKKADEREQKLKYLIEGKTNEELLSKLLSDNITSGERQHLASTLGIDYGEVNTKIKRLYYKLPYEEAIQLIKSAGIGAHKRKYLCKVWGLDYQKFNTKVKRVEV